MESSDDRWWRRLRERRRPQMTTREEWFLLNLDRASDLALRQRVAAEDEERARIVVEGEGVTTRT